MLNRLSRFEQEALEEFRGKIVAVLGDRLLRVALFGSKLTGAATSESDIDVWIVVDDTALKFKEEILDAAFDANLKYGVYISPRVMPASVLRHRVWSRTPFLRGLQQKSFPL